MFKNILMPTDGSEHSERAIERGIELAKLCGAKVTGIHVMPAYRPSMVFGEGVYLGPELDEKLEGYLPARAARIVVSNNDLQ
jgi:nucleotide-binding universal stress UspA family protein